MLVLIHFTLGIYLFIRFLSHPWRTQKGPPRQLVTIIIIAHLLIKPVNTTNNNNYWYDWQILKPCQNNSVLNMPIKRCMWNSHLNYSERTFPQWKCFTGGRNVVFSPWMGERWKADYKYGLPHERQRQIFQSFLVMSAFSLF